MTNFVPYELLEERINLTHAMPIDIIDAWQGRANKVIEQTALIASLEAQLAATQARLAEYEVGFDPKVHPAPDTWVLMMDCDDVYFPVQFDPSCAWYWNYQGGSNGEIDYWNDDDIDLRKWFPLPGSKGGEE